MSRPHSFEEQIARVQAMAHDANGEAWDLGGTDRAALLAVLASHRELLAAAQGAWHLCQSLLAVREGATDDLIRRVADALHAAIAKAEGR